MKMAEQASYDTTGSVQVAAAADVSVSLNQILTPDTTKSNLDFNSTERTTTQSSLTKDVPIQVKVDDITTTATANNPVTVPISWANRVKATNNRNESSVVSTQPISSTTTATQHGNTSAVQESIVVKDDNEIDSALLAGMCDAKERVALLRLEVVLTDFMNCDASWIEVGGPYNLTVYSDNNRLIVRNTTENTTAQNGYPEPGLGQRQTSFQKCILHKCADRFKIIREPGILLFGSLRLIKLATSKIPTRLLKDLDPSEYLNNANVYDSRQSYYTSHTYEPRQQPQQHHNLPSGVNNGGKINTGTEQKIPASIASINETLGNVSLGESREESAPVPPITYSNTGVTSAATMKPKKMKIMKRADKPKSSATSTEAQQTKFLRKNSSELSDKEKAYAEARARIFNEESSASSLFDIEGKSVIVPTDTNTEVESGSMSNIPSLSSHVSEDLHADSSETGRRPASPSQVKEDALTASSASGQNGENLLQSSGNGSSSNLPLLENKAVYRNRAEEAADPDFRRHRNNHVMVPSAPMFAVSPSVVPVGPLHTQSTSAVMPPYSTAPNWIQPSATPYTTMQHAHLHSQVMQQPFHPTPFQVQATGRQQMPPHYQQHPSQHFMYPQQPYHMYDVGMSPQEQGGNVSVVGNFQHQQHLPNAYNDYNSGRYYKKNNGAGGNVHYQNGGATGQQRNNAATLKAAAPAFYPSKSSQAPPTNIISKSGDSVNASNQPEQTL